VGCGVGGLTGAQVAALKRGFWSGADPLGRLPGEALWPERHAPSDLERVAANVGAYEFAAVYQQAPQTRQGTLIKAREIVPVGLDALPEALTLARYWDLAVSERKGADWIVGALVGRAERNLYIIHVARFPGPWSEAKERIVQVMLRDPAAVRQGVEVAGQQGGYYQELRDDPRLVGRSIEGVNPQQVGNKAVRAQVWASRIVDGLVHLVTGNGWNVDVFLNECALFPLGKHDDQVDGVSGAVQMLGEAVLEEMTSEDPGSDFGGYDGRR
jgi:predicted phage terminase large subunit-like protein